MTDTWHRNIPIFTLVPALTQDEDCWIGELNGLRGWFPAKFVQLLDERSKQYSSAGDDSANENVAHLVRGTLAPTIKHILEHGMRKSTILGNIIFFFTILLYCTTVLKLYDVKYLEIH